MGCRPNVQMSVPSNLKMSVSPAFWLGRKPKLTEHQKREVIRRRDHDGKPVRGIARSYNVSHSTISPVHSIACSYSLRRWHFAGPGIGRNVG
jgi:hypothetical protein